jgi:cytochrome c peroxidase
VTPARVDDWLAGNDKAITAVEKQGYKLFHSKGCASCHNCINFGGNSFAKFGKAGQGGN